jgi:hypothetical protein
MPSVSQQQQKLFGLALSVKRGETPESEASDDVMNIVNTMSEKDIEKYAKTPHSGLPKKAKAESLSELRKIIREEIQRITESLQNSNNNISNGKVGKKQVHESALDTFINFFKRMKPGRVIIRNGKPRKIYVVSRIEKGEDFDVFVFDMGTIDQNRAILIHNREGAKIVGLSKNTKDFESYRLPTSEERKMIKTAMGSGKYDEYIKNAISKIGMKPIL